MLGSGVKNVPMSREQLRSLYPMFIGTARNNGSPKMSGAGYGIKLNPRDRDKYFRKPKAFLRLEGQAGDISVNTDKPSFWNGTVQGTDQQEDRILAYK